MKNTFFLLLFSTLLIFSCEKDKYESSGTITGADLAMCACCGGYFVDINGTQYRFEKSELPSNFTFTDDQLPLRVELDWELKTEICTGFEWIKISKIKAIR
jgi:hypothetical protein